jgi:organic radical activating enzyme
MTASANISEVFSGVQGEGIFVGRRQLFVRFGGCNLSCEYCDTAGTRKGVPLARIEQAAGLRRFTRVRNPVAAADLAKSIARLDPDRLHESVSLTGGEPLLAAGFLAELIPLCEGRNFYLETNGTLPRELEKVVHLVRVVAMDIKLASATGQVADLEVSREFLSIAVRRQVFVKVVVASRTQEGELAVAARAVASVSRDIPFVIQPVTPTAGKIVPPDPARQLVLQMTALRILADVRIIPQVHRLMGQK